MRICHAQRPSALCYPLSAIGYKLMISTFGLSASSRFFASA